MKRGRKERKEEEEVGRGRGECEGEGREGRRKKNFPNLRPIYVILIYLNPLSLLVFPLD